MLGAIVGDIIGSVYEFDPVKTKDFELFTERSGLTDDSIMTIAVGCAAATSDLNDENDFKSNLVKWMRKLGKEYPDAGYGGMFSRWLRDENMGPYNSFGNGSAMRVSPIAVMACNSKKVEELARWTAEVTHNHPEGIKGAQAVAAAVFLAAVGCEKEKIKEYIEENYYKLDFTLDEIRDSYTFDETCQRTVPQAIQCFLEADSFEDTVRNAVSLGGDADTLAAIAGSIAHMYYGIPEDIEKRAVSCMDDRAKEYYEKYIKKYWE